LSFVFAIVGNSFRSLPGALLPGPNARKLAALALAVALAASGCGGGKQHQTTVGTKRVLSSGFAFRVPHGWSVARAARTVTASSGGSIVSVTSFRLAHQYRPALWNKVVGELDGVASRLAATEKGKLEHGRTEQIAGGNARVYEIVRAGSTERIAFVLHGRREYQLYCRPAGSACSLLLGSFSLR
jgi:plasmid stabilization system protein ParE